MKSNKGNLNYTLDNIRMSNKSINSKMGSKKSLSGQVQKHSIVSAADNIMNKRKRQSKAVHDGYNSNKIFEHTIADIIKVLEKELESQGISPNLARQGVKK